LYLAFLEEVQDPAISRLEYQGAVFPFTGGLEAGMHRLKIRSNGDIFVGGLGNGEQTNKGWRGTRFGLQKISAIPGDTAFDMLAVRSRRNGMEIEFTRPVGASGAWPPITGRKSGPSGLRNAMAAATRIRGPT
jgi:hypothetical protein